MRSGDDTRAEALERSVRLCGEAWACGNSVVLDSLLSPTYTHGDVFGGFQDRATWLSYASGRAGKSTRIGFRELSFRFFTESAVVTGINDVESMDAHGDEMDLRFTQIWLWRDGRWLREAFQATIINRG